MIESCAVAIVLQLANLKKLEQDLGDLRRNRMNEFDMSAYLEHIRIHRNESKPDLAKWGWRSRQAEIDALIMDRDFHRDLSAKRFEMIKELESRLNAVDVLLSQAKDGYYGFSSEGGDIDNLVKHLEKALRGNDAT